MNDDLTSLASAYLDGDVTPHERARVDGDPEALAEVDRLRTVRFLLGDVEQPSISTREAHLASAIDAWSRIPEAERTGARRDRAPVVVGIDAAAVAGAASVTAPTPPRGDRRRTTSTRWLSSAAAGLVLVLAGGLALQLGTGSDDDSSSSTSADSATNATESTSSGDAASTEERISADQADDALAAPAGGTSNEATAELDTGVAEPAPPGEDVGLQQLQTPSDLADFAAAAVDAPISPDVPAATSAPSGESPPGGDTFLADSEFPVCLGVDVVVGPAVYGDVAVVVGIDEGRNLAIAYRAATCVEVARVRLP